MTALTAPQTPPRKADLFAALLSYLIPGMGQVIQGRIGKGLLFFVCLHALFFYGWWMGQKKNVWLPEPSGLPAARLPLVGELGGPFKSAYYRPQFLGQFWMGVAVWPAVAQYAMTKPPERNDAAPDPLPVLGRLMQAPPEIEINALQRSGDKRFDLGWVYTVIAGVLNLLVIYDALSGPVLKDDEDKAPAEVPTPARGAGS